MSKTISLKAVNQICMGGVVNPNGWRIVDDAGNYYGFVFYSPNDQFGDGRYWLEAPRMKRRGYASLTNAIRAIEQKAAQ